MIYRIIQPSTHLKAFIKDYLLLHFVFDKLDSVPVKPFPANTQQNLVFYSRGNITARNSISGKSQNFPRISINGSQISRFDFHLSQDYLVLSINFQPDVLPKLLKSSLTEFVDERIDAESILNPGIHRVHEQMANSNSYDEIIPVIEDFLWKRIQNLKTNFDPIDMVTRMISENNGIISVEKMASDACLSISQFERKFVKQMGFTPKLFARITRFYNAYQIKDQNPDIDWLSVALESGYHDYQHLVKDFKQFADSTPHSLLQAQARAPERILGIG